MDTVSNIITHNIWVLIPLCALLIPIFAIAVGGWTGFLHYRYRREALETLKAYANSGKEPPEALVAALAGRRGRQEWDDGEWAPRAKKWKDGIEEEFSDPERFERRRRRRIAHDWRGFIWCSAVAAGFYMAWTFIRHSEGFLIVAIIMTCVSAASLLGAILTTALNRK
jgi:hypothetical protein